jgi:uncharacterized protein (TIGR03083 family)
VTSERRLLVRLFEPLEGEQWSVPSLCPGWTVHDVLAHLASALDASTGQTLKAAVRGFGRPAAVIEALTRAYAPRPSEELVATYRKHVDSTFGPPGLGWRASLTDVMVHARDVAVPLGIEHHRPAESWQPVLEFLTAGIPMLGSIRGGRPKVTWRTTDLDWSAGTGPEVTGAAEDVGVTLAGRGARLEALSGPGRESLATWVG